MTDEGQQGFEWSWENLARVDVLRAGSEVVVTFRGLPLMSYPTSDPVARDMTIAMLRRIGLSGERVAELTDMSTGHVSNVSARVAAGGMAALAQRGKAGRKRLLSSAAERSRVRALHGQGVSQEETAKRLGVAPKTVQRVEREMGLERGSRRQQVALEGVGEARSKSTRRGVKTPSESPPEGDPEPAGLTEPEPSWEAAAEPDGDEEEAKELAPGAELPVGPAEHPSRYAATLLLAAAMGQIGVTEALDAAGVRRPGRAVYDAREVCVALMCAWVSGHGSLESMHERDARGLGAVLGLERSPSVRTLHRAVDQMVRRYDPIALGTELMGGLAQAFADEPLLFGVDGHHKEYSGDAPIDKGFNTKKRMATKGVGDILVHDLYGTTWWNLEVKVGDPLSQHVLTVARKLRQVHGTWRPLLLAFDRGGFALPVLNALAAEGFHYLVWVPANVTTPDLSAVAPAHDGVGEVRWKHSSLDHDSRLLVERDGDALLPVTTNLPVGDAASVIGLLRKLRGVEENSIKAARRSTHIDRLVDRGIRAEGPDDRLVPNPERRALTAQERQLRNQTEELAKYDRTFSAEGVVAELQLALVKRQLPSLPAKVPRVQLEPEARRAWLDTRNRGLLQPLKYAADNARRWLLRHLDRALAPSDRDYDASALPRTLDALLQAPGTIRFEADRIVVSINLQLPPTAHARLDRALRALRDLPGPLTHDQRPIGFELAPRPTRQALPHRRQTIKRAA